MNSILVLVSIRDGEEWTAAVGTEVKNYDTSSSKRNVRHR